VWVAVGTSRRDLDYGDGFAGEDCVENGGEFGVAVADEVSELVGAVADLPQQVSGLLGGPGGGGVGGDAEDVDSAGADLHDEQRVEPLQRDRVQVEEVCGQKSAGLEFEEGTPLTARPVPPRWRSNTDAAQNPADGGGADAVPEATQFAVYAAESPTRVLGTEPGDELAHFIGDGWAARGRWLGPLSLDQTLGPGQLGAWGDDPVAAKCAG
jgi:hypothetical protein